jgi:hypothetical protein
MPDILDISSTMTGRALPRDQAMVVARVKGLSLDDHSFIRGRYRDPVLEGDVDYVLVQHRHSPKWHTFKLEDLNRDILKESANVP